MTLPCRIQAETSVCDCVPVIAETVTGICLTPLLYQRNTVVQVTILDFGGYCSYISRMETKPTLGRPPKGGETRTARIGIRAQPSDKERYARAAEIAGMTLSDWMKARLDRAARRELGD